jgi:hypothetical protein
VIPVIGYVDFRQIEKREDRPARGRANKLPGIQRGHGTSIISCRGTRRFDRRWGIGYS